MSDYEKQLRLINRQKLETHKWKRKFLRLKFRVKTIGPTDYDIVRDRHWTAVRTLRKEHGPMFKRLYRDALQYNVIEKRKVLPLP